MSSVSQFPRSEVAAGELLGNMLDADLHHPDFAILFVSEHHNANLQSILNTIDEILLPGVLIGAWGVQVIGTNQEVEYGPGMSLICGKAPNLCAVEIRPADYAEGIITNRFIANMVNDWKQGANSVDLAGIYLIADYDTFPASSFFGQLQTLFPKLPITGGRVGEKGGLIFGSSYRQKGAIGIAFGSKIEYSHSITHSCKAIGAPMAVTKADKNIIFELAGRPALDRLTEIAKGPLTKSDLDVIGAGGLRIGVAIKENDDMDALKVTIRSVVGADPVTGAIVTDDEVELGQTIQFQVQDNKESKNQLKKAANALKGDAYLITSSASRGSSLYEKAHQDTYTLSASAGPRPTAGFFSHQEFGVVDGVLVVQEDSISIGSISIK